MRDWRQMNVLATLALVFAAGSLYAQGYPYYPYDYRPGNAGVMGVGPGGREAYHPMYYSAVPDYGYWPGYNYTPNITGLPSLPIVDPEIPLRRGYQSGYYAPPTVPNPNAALIDVIVPPGARLWFQGHETRQQGPERFFESPPLQPGEKYAYKVKAQWTAANGETVERTRTLHVRAGSHLALDLWHPPS